MLPEWLVEDGEISDLQLGSIWHQVAVRAAAWELRAGDGPLGIEERTGFVDQGSGCPTYAVTGTAVWVREPASVVLQVDDAALVVEPNGVREIASAPGDYALEPYAPGFTLPAVGSQAIALCTFEVMADYETHAFGLPDTRRDWTVRARRPRPADGEGAAVYVVDLEPAG